MIGVDLEPLDYDRRLAALLRARVGLWDTVASARRAGSLDSAMRETEANSLAGLVGELPDLRAVGFNGKAAARIGAPQLAEAALPLVVLPSSSPANASMPLAEKEKLWAPLSEFLA